MSLIQYVDIRVGEIFSLAMAYCKIYINTGLLLMDKSVLLKEYLICSVSFSFANIQLLLAGKDE